MLMLDFTCAPFSQDSFAGSDLDPSCLKRLSADDTSSRWLRTQMGAEKETEHFLSSSEGRYESAHAGILARTFCRAWTVFKGYQQSTLVHLIGAEKRKILCWLSSRVSNAHTMALKYNYIFLSNSGSFETICVQTDKPTYMRICRQASFI